MYASRRLIVALVLVVAGGCGPSSVKAHHDGGGDDDIDAGTNPPPPTGSIAGTVWAPGNAIGAVPAGFEIPIAGAMIYLTDTDPKAIPDGVYCDRCEPWPGTFTTSDPKGKFTLPGATPGTHKLVIEKAQFRLVETVDVPSDTGLTLTAAQTTLPSKHD